MSHSRVTMMVNYIDMNDGEHMLLSAHSPDTIEQVPNQSISRNDYHRLCLLAMLHNDYAKNKM